MLGSTQFLTPALERNPSSEKGTQVGFLCQHGFLLGTHVVIRDAFGLNVVIRGSFCRELLKSTSQTPCPLTQFPARKNTFMHWYVHFQIYILSSKRNIM